MNVKSLNKLKTNLKMILTMNANSVLNLRTNSSNLKINLVEKMSQSQNYSSKLTIFSTKTRIFRLKMIDLSTNLPVYKNFMVEKSMNYKHNC